MRPTLRQMKYVLTVHQLESFSLAAEALNVSQPSLSNQIAAVEEKLGLRLFSRGRGGVTTTAKGLDFVGRARHILSEVDALNAAMTSSLPFGGRLRLGVLPSIGPYLLPQAVQSLHEGQPDLRVLVREENTLSLDEGIRNGRFDAIISTPEDHPNTHQYLLFRETLWAAVSNDHKLVQKKQLTAEDLSGQRLLTLDNGHRLARIVYAIASISGGIVSNDYEGTSLDSIMLMAATGTGIAILPELFALRQAIFRKEVTVLPLQIPDADRAISLLFPSSQRHHNSQESLASILKIAAKELGMQADIR